MPQTETPATNLVRVTFIIPDNPETIDVDIDESLTGHAAIRGLVQEAGLAPPSASLSYALHCKRTQSELPLDRPLITGGVQAGDVLKVVRSDIAAGSA